MAGSGRNISGKIFTSPSFGLGGDCIQVFGSDGYTLIDSCIFDLAGVPLSGQDEAIDLIKGARADIRRCVFLGCKKAILAGNGDWPDEDAAGGRVSLSQCVFIGCGRRCPEVQDGVRASMSDCWVHNWGAGCFDVRTFGAWSHRGATLTVKDSLFSRTRGLTRWHWVADHANHIGEAVNDGTLLDVFSKTSWISGAERGLDYSGGGLGASYGCRFIDCRQVGGAQQDVGSPSLAWLKDMPDTTHTSLGMPLAEFAALELGC